MQQAAWQIENLLHEKSQQAAGPYLPGLAWERSYIARTSPVDSLTGPVVINAIGTLLLGAGIGASHLAGRDLLNWRQDPVS